MIKKLLLGSLFFISVYTFAQQDKKWSIEANYPISIGGDLGNDNPGIVDLGVKYRFLDLSFAKIGVGINAGVFTDQIQSFDNAGGGDETFNFKETNWVFSPKVFSEFTIPGAEKLRPSVSLGYSIVSSKVDGQSFGESISASDSDGGLNLGLGISYDISKRVFIQAQYDFIPLNDTDQNLGFLKLGVGFRF